MLTSRACHSIILLAEAVVRLGRLQGVEGGHIAKAVLDTEWFVCVVS
jgi:hypothetical protein